MWGPRYHHGFVLSVSKLPKVVYPTSVLDNQQLQTHSPSENSLQESPVMGHVHEAAEIGAVADWAFEEVLAVSVPVAVASGSAFAAAVSVEGAAVGFVAVTAEGCVFAAEPVGLGAEAAEGLSVEPGAVAASLAIVEESAAEFEMAEIAAFVAAEDPLVEAAVAESAAVGAESAVGFAAVSSAAVEAEGSVVAAIAAVSAFAVVAFLAESDAVGESDSEFDVESECYVVASGVAEVSVPVLDVAVEAPVVVHDAAVSVPGVAAAVETVLGFAAAAVETAPASDVAVEWMSAESAAELSVTESAAAAVPGSVSAVAAAVCVTEGETGFAAAEGHAAVVVAFAAMLNVVSAVAEAAECFVGSAARLDSVAEVPAAVYRAEESAVAECFAAWSAAAAVV